MSVKVPKETIEDIILKVNKFYFATDFVVLDTKLVTNPSSHSSVILGRPFFTTADVVIRCKNRVMTLSFWNMTAELNISHTSSQPPVMDDHEEVSMNDISVNHTFESLIMTVPWKNTWPILDRILILMSQQKRSNHC